MVIHSEDDYAKGVRELGDLIERENSLPAIGIQRLSDLADALIAWEETHDSLVSQHPLPKLEGHQIADSSQARAALAAGTRLRK